ncbi:MAG: calcium/sodium antiporter [Lachnospiraceae bacterium]|nr:calcium/sodium antiporter [Lachnospiraceae bacterium]
MDLLIDIVLLVIGFVLLVKGADFFVDGSSTVAKVFKIPSIIVGLTIVAMGTSLPELSVSLVAALNGANEIAVSNVVGSNVFNLIVVLGACAIISPIAVDKSVVKREFPFSIIITIVLALMIADNYLPLIPDYKPEIAEGAEKMVGIIDRLDGAILLIIFIGFMVYTVMTALNQRKAAKEQPEEDGPKKNIFLAILFIVGGIAAIKFGGDFVVDSAKSLAIRFGMSETLVGLTIVAVGTSLPELVTSVVAARKGETSLAIGNVVGSNIFNVLLILGVSSLISPVGVVFSSLIDMIILIFLSVLVLVFVKTKERIDRKEGIIMVALYIAYMVYAIIR